MNSKLQIITKLTSELAINSCKSLNPENKTSNFEGTLFPKNEIWV